MFFLLTIIATFAFSLQSALMVSYYRKMDPLYAISVRGISVAVAMLPLLFFVPAEDYIKVVDFLPHLAAVDDPAPIAVSDEDVLRDGEVGEDHGLLVDGRYGVGLGVKGASDVDLLAVDEDVADVGLDDAGHDLDQR